jgi:formyltetrahydrofolate deformylase
MSDMVNAKPAPKDVRPQQWVLTLSCPDTPGIVHGVSSYLLVTGCTILDSQQYGDPDTGLFFMRVSFSRLDSDVTLEALNSGFEAIGNAFHMSWQFHDTATLMPIILMVSKFGHCLNDLLFRASIGALPVRIAAVVSNHRDFEELTRSYGHDFVHLPVAQGDPTAKAAAEAKLLELVEERGVELVVLARYMQVLSDDVCKALEGRMINIHHSFLPGFKGANPYKQAHARGVKLIGATAHFVTADLDEGPIIEQNVVRVDHAHTVPQLVAIGQDEESRTLTQAVKWVAEGRVLLDGARTIIFR